jgi:hypothetical protein
MYKLALHRHPRLLLVACAALVGLFSGCGLVDEVLNPGDGFLGLELEGPPGATVTLSLRLGSTLVEQVTDDGRGFKKTALLKPGTYTVTASPVSGYVAYVAVTQANGNSTKADAQTVQVLKEATALASVYYVSSAPTP